MRLASPVGLQALVESARWLAFFLILEQVSEDTLALSSLVYACFAVLLIPAQAFGETAYSLVSNLIGRGHGDQIGRLMLRVLLPAYLVTAPLVVVTVLYPELPLSVFTSDPETSGAAVTAAGPARREPRESASARRAGRSPAVAASARPPEACRERAGASAARAGASWRRPRR
jgi:hypothetical protein